MRELRSAIIFLTKKKTAVHKWKLLHFSIFFHLKFIKYVKYFLKYFVVIVYQSYVLIVENFT